GKWDQLLIRRGLAALGRALPLDDAAGPYVLQATIAACHARARTAADTDGPASAGHYDRPPEDTPSAVVELNRAVAHAMAFGPARGLMLLDAVAEAPALRNYHLLPSVRGDFLMKLGRLGEARIEFERAAEMTRNERERALLLERAGA